jgi:hypothetical protein
MAMTTPGNDRSATKPSGAARREQNASGGRPDRPSKEGSKRAAEAAAKSAARRQRLLLGGIGLAFVAVFVAVVALWPSSKPVKKVTASAPKGTESFDGLTRNHVTGRVDYPQTPPVGGDHNSVWWNCGAYSSAIPTEQGVHSMEHGAVWITYAGIPDQQVKALDALAAPGRFILVTPWDTSRGALPSKIVASAWGEQLKLDSPADPRLSQFISTFERGEQTPEPGAACSGGDGTPM